MIEALWFIDGTYYQGLNASHVFDKPGTYEVILSISDDAANIGVDSVVINISAGEVDDVKEEPGDVDDDIMWAPLVILGIMMLIILFGVIVWTRRRMETSEE